MSELAAALQVAIRVHAGQTDKQGEPYLLHVLRVVEAASSEPAKILAALHDVWEDGGVDALDPEALFERDGMFISNSLEVLTRSEGETYADYIQGIADGHSGTWVAEIREVKLADLRDNLGRIPERPRNAVGGPASEVVVKDWASLRRRYEKAITTLESAGPWHSSEQETKP